jgi:predicted DNA binding protein
MKSLRLKGRPDQAAAPDLFAHIADSPHVREARLVGWNLAADPGATVLFAVDGDVEGFRAAFPDDTAVVSTDIARVSEGHFVLLLRVAPDESSVFGTMLATVRRDGLVVVKPVVYRDGQVHARIVGESAVVQAFVEALPPLVNVDVREVGSGGFDPTAPAASLADRQREALLAALELGYYDPPTDVTHEDVAAALGCAPSTASEHLRKAESKLVRRAMRGLVDDPV